MNKKPIVPSEAEILNAYSALQSGVSLSIQEWIRFAQWIRFDPRLGELWLQRFDQCWRDLSPVELRLENFRQASPAVLGVLLWQYQKYICPKEERPVFRHWSATVLEGTPKAHYEGFFIGCHGFASPRTLGDAEGPIESYKKWGYFGRDVFLNKFSLHQKRLQKTGMAPPERKKILLALLKSKGRIQVKDYVSACADLISNRVAQKDLKAMKGLKCVGKTRAKFYIRESKR